MHAIKYFFNSVFYALLFLLLKIKKKLKIIKLFIEIAIYKFKLIYKLKLYYKNLNLNKIKNPKP